MGRTQAAHHVALTCMILCSLAGCKKREALEPPLAELPGVMQTHHAELRAELARLVAERATPQLLENATSSASQGEQGTRSSPDPDRVLEDVLSAKRAALLLQRLNRFYPQGRFEFDPIAFENAMGLRSQFGAELEQYRQIFSGEHFRFHVSLDSGLLADLAFLDHATLAHRLEAIDAQEALVAGQPQETVLPLRNMLRIDAQLARLQHVASRLTAATLRAEAPESRASDRRAPSIIGRPGAPVARTCRYHARQLAAGRRRLDRRSCDGLAHLRDGACRQVAEHSHVRRD